MSENKVILFPLDRIKNKNNTGPSDTSKQQKKIEQQQTKEFVEAATDDIALDLLRKFVDLAIRTNTEKFTKDLSLLVDVMRGLIYRDFNQYHPAQDLSDKIVTVSYDRQGQQVAKLDYSKVIDKKHKIHKPLSEDLKNELEGLDSSVEFENDFNLPDDDK